MWCSQEELDMRIRDHELWLTNPNAANARKFETRNVDEDLSGADFRGARLLGANFSGADLTRACFAEALLWDANFSGACLESADLIDARCLRTRFARADLSHVNARGAHFSDADLTRVQAPGADFFAVRFSVARLVLADLRCADLTHARLEGANLDQADLSGALGLLDPVAWLAEHFDSTRDGLIVYKRLGQTEYPAPGHWRIEPSAILTETVNPNRTNACGCGVNFGTYEWCQVNYTDAALWKCRIRWIDLAGVVVPYNTDGKARCARLELLEPIEST